MHKNTWDQETIEKLNDYQRNGHFHPYTCGSGNRGDEAHRKYADEYKDPDWGLLVATENGWKCPVCDYTQDWYHGASVTICDNPAIKEYFDWIDGLKGKNIENGK